MSTWNRLNSLKNGVLKSALKSAMAHDPISPVVQTECCVSIFLFWFDLLRCLPCRFHEEPGEGLVGLCPTGQTWVGEGCFPGTWVTCRSQVDIHGASLCQVCWRLKATVFNSSHYPVWQAFLLNTTDWWVDWAQRFEPRESWSRAYAFCLTLPL